MAKPHFLETPLRPLAPTLLALACRQTLIALSCLGLMVPPAWADGLLARHPEGSSRVVTLPPAPDLAAAWQAGRSLAQGERITLALSAAQAPADGSSTLRVDITLSDPSGAPLPGPVRVLLETSLGTWQLSPAAPAAAQQDALAGASSLEILVQRGQASLLLRTANVTGQALLRASSGRVGVQGEVYFAPDLRPLLAVGIVEGAIQLGQKHRSALSPALGNTGFEDNLRHWQANSADGERQLTGRAAFYLKGTIKGDILLTAAADSDKLTRQKLFRDIDPNQFYPVYGDASTREFDARSASRLFVRVDKDRSYALYGDIHTASDNPAQRLAAYARSLTGARVHHEAGPLQFNAFASRDRLRQYVDEQAGRGISGPYAIGQPNALANSERVEILVRDRAQPALVLRRTLLTRFVDYDFEPFSGRVLFRLPVASVDERLNPVSIRIAYEVDEGGSPFWVGGADARWRVSDSLSLGAAHAEDRNTAAPYKLSGLNAAWAVAAQTRVQAELATSHGTAQYNQTLTSAAPGLALAASGRAARVELQHQSEGLHLRAQAARAEAGFQNSQAGLSPGRQELSLNAAHTLTPEFKLNLELLGSQDRGDTPSRGAARRSATAGVEWKATPALRLDLAVNQVNERQLAGSGGFLSAVDAQAASSSVPGLGTGNNASTNTSFGFAGSGLLASPVALAPSSNAAPALVDHAYTSLRARLNFQATPELALYAEAEEADRSRRRLAAGGEYKLDDKSRLYARHEFANSLTGSYGLTADGSRSHNTVLGVDSAYMRDGQVFSEFRLAGGQNGSDAAAAIGVRNLWKLGAGLAVTTALERQAIHRADGSVGQAGAVALGAEYNADPALRAGGKLEWRESSNQHSQLASFALDRKLDSDWTALLRGLVMDNQGRSLSAGNDDQQQRVQLGLAYRDTQSNRWHGLARLEARSDEHWRAAASTGYAGHDSLASWVASLHANYRADPAWTHSAQVAVKRVHETLSGPVPITSRWQGGLLAGRTLWDLNDRWDLSAYGSWQQGQGARLRGVGAELGWRVQDNLWLSGGWTWGRYSDADLFSSNTSWSGLHVRLRFKFDEHLFTALRPGAAAAAVELKP